jgi:hypothetical protein
MATIDLSGVKPFAIGKTRKCYVNPENSDQCVKIGYNSNLPYDNKNEHQAVNTVLSRFPTPLTVPPYCRWVETSEGRGIVTKLFYLNGDISPKLNKYIEQNPNDEGIYHSILWFFAHIKREAPTIKLIKIHNLVVTNADSGSDNSGMPLCIKMIDDFGAKNPIPLDKWFLFARKIAVRTRIKRFYERYPQIAQKLRSISDG